MKANWRHFTMGAAIGVAATIAVVSTDGNDAHSAPGINPGAGAASATGVQLAQGQLRVEGLNAAVKRVIENDLTIRDAVIQQVITTFRSEPNLINEIGAVPLGAVMAFDRPEGCRKMPGWTEFEAGAGRFLIGVDGDKYDLSYSAGRPNYEIGGAETHTLMPNEMPVHTHGVRQGANYRVDHPGEVRSSKVGVTRVDKPSDIGTVNSSVAGGGGPHNNMPPYIALYFCKKTAQQTAEAQ